MSRFWGPFKTISAYVFSYCEYESTLTALWNTIISRIKNEGLITNDLIVMCSRESDKIVQILCMARPKETRHIFNQKYFWS
ncbi:hypothetical protein LH89_20090 [Dickeya fangzhongdai]|nr:hypothetical protein LH89_20090 [Dickeya fangzhongdai]